MIMTTFSRFYFVILFFLFFLTQVRLQAEDQNILLSSLEQEQNPKTFSETLKVYLEKTAQPKEIYIQLRKLEIQPQNNLVLTRTLLSLALLLGDNNGALMYLKKLDEQNSSTISESTLAVKLYIDRGDLHQAKNLLQVFQKRHPKAIALHEMQASILYHENNLNEAEKILTQYYDLLNPFGLDLLINIYQEMGEQEAYQKAKRTLKRRFPSSPTQLIWQGRALATPSLQNLLHTPKTRKIKIQVLALTHQDTIETEQKKLNSLGYQTKIEFQNNLYKLIVITEKKLTVILLELEKHSYSGFPLRD